MTKMEFLGIGANQMAVMRGTLDNGETLTQEWDAECLQDAIRNHAYAKRFSIAAICETALSELQRVQHD